MTARQRSWLLPPCAAALVSGVLVGKPMDEAYEAEYREAQMEEIGNP